MAELVKAKLASGVYADESEVVEDGLHMLMGRDAELEHWLRTDVIAAIEEFEGNPSSARSVDEVRASLAAEHARLLATQK